MEREYGTLKPDETITDQELYGCEESVPQEDEAHFIHVEGGWGENPWTNPVALTVPDPPQIEDLSAYFKPEELVSDQSGRLLPRLHGLRRVASPYIQTEEHVVQLVVVPNEKLDKKTKQVIKTSYFPMATVVYTAALKNGRVFSDAADAYHLNCDGLGHFPTAVAASRAEARVLRKILGIKEHAAEEISDKNAVEELEDPEDATNEQIKVIETKLMRLDGVTLAEALAWVTTREETYNPADLTFEEARHLIRLLNEKKIKKGKKNAS